jgi:N-acetylglucosaminyldiphosphoundecaprenol N-acetyl-beta-D-mannosaminyltransferase
MMSRIDILGTPVDPLDTGMMLERVAGWLDDPPGGLRHIVTVNPEYVIAARRQRRFHEALRSSELALADGVGIVLAARLLRLPALTRVTGNDLVEAVAGLDHPNKRIFLLGASEGVAAQAAAVLCRRHPAAGIVGTLPGDPSPDGWAGISEQLAATHPNVLFVAFGHPRQDLWIAAHRAALEEHGILVAAGVGGVYDYLSGRVPRAPALFRRLGLEWLYRLIRQPWRWRRQLVLPVFLLLVLRAAVTRTVRRVGTQRDREGNG